MENLSDDRPYINCFMLMTIDGKVTGNLNVSISEIMELKDKFDNDDNKEDFNLSCLDILLKHKILKKDLASKLVNGGKLKVDENKANNIINKYE